MNKIWILGFLVLLNSITTNREKSNTILNSAQEEVEEILHILYETNGNFQFEIPKLYIDTSTFNIALYYPKRNEIRLEYKAYEICKSFGKYGKDALAFIIGHELSHAYQAKQLKSIDRTSYLAFDYIDNGKKHLENSADIHGVFNAYLAGFESNEILPALLDSLYTTYHLKNKKLRRYPSLKERQNTAHNVLKKVAKLSMIYENASYLMAIGEYELAAVSLEYIESEYKGREIYNNLGVNYALAAMNMGGKNIDPFLYPLEIDFDSKLKKPENYRGDDLSVDEIRNRQEFLGRAKKYLEIAKVFDPTYFIADVNYMCVLNLTGQYQEVVDYYQEEELIQKAATYQIEEHTVQLAKSALAIAYARLNTSSSKTKAKAIWEEQKKSIDPMIALLGNSNLEKLKRRLFKPRQPKECYQPFDIFNRVDGVTIQRVRLDDFFALREDNTIKMALQEKKQSVIAQFHKNGFKFTLQRVHTIPEKYIWKQQKTKGEFISLSDGLFHICEEDEVIFKYDKEGVLQEWAKFQGFN